MRAALSSPTAAAHARDATNLFESLNGGLTIRSDAHGRRQGDCSVGLVVFGPARREAALSGAN
jgi:hypothetical protein